MQAHDEWSGGQIGQRAWSRALAQVVDALDDLGALDPAYLATDAKADVLRTLTVLGDRVAELRLRTLAVATDVGEEVGARNAGAWLAREMHLTRATMGREQRLADALTAHSSIAAALAAGQLRVEQASVIVRAVDDLPESVTADVRAEARDHLLELAAHHDARDLQRLGKRILDVIAPEMGEAHELQQLEREEARAAATARFTMTDDGEGRCHGRFTLPSVHGELLRQHLLALADPRRVLPGDEQGLEPDSAERRRITAITPERMGQALMEYVERFPADRLPTHGGLGAGSVGVSVLIDYDSLIDGLGVGVLTSGHRITAGEARRLVCQAGIVPAVLGGASEVLDLGRLRRFYSPAQRRALDLRDRGCTADGCDAPASICHAHHDDPWSSGGRTDLELGRLLCAHHHRLAHRRDYEMRRGHGRTVTFHRRT